MLELKELHPPILGEFTKPIGTPRSVDADLGFLGSTENRLGYYAGNRRDLISRGACGIPLNENITEVDTGLTDHVIRSRDFGCVRLTSF
ncbi:hypothetical protein, partial [Arthrobacter sp. ZGTC131]|uniref:hypothetical protein n=1 Tax=Arthrobacter sp. ZGTC131 TaxID=2058898 RepID=UPI00215814A8